MVVPAMSIAHALVDSPSQVIEIHMGALDAQLVDEAINAFKERIDNSSISPFMWKNILEPQTYLKLRLDCVESKCLTP